MKEQQWLEDGWFYHNHAWHLLHEILKLIRPIDATSLLDFGAGTGLAAAVIKAVFPEMKVHVQDIERNCIDFWKTRKLFGWCQLPDSKKYPCFDNYFDIAMSSHVIEHLENPGELIQEMFRVAKKRIIIVVPDGDCHFYDHKIIYDRQVLSDTIHTALEGEEFKYDSFPVYHSHINNLVAVIDK